MTRFLQLDAARLDRLRAGLGDTGKAMLASFSRRLKPIAWHARGFHRTAADSRVPVRECLGQRAAGSGRRLASREGRRGIRRDRDRRRAEQRRRDLRDRELRRRRPDGERDTRRRQRGIRTAAAAGGGRVPRPAGTGRRRLVQADERARRSDGLAGCAPRRPRRILVSTATCITVLTTQLGFSSGELADLSRGQIVKRGLPSRAPARSPSPAPSASGRRNQRSSLRVRDIERFKSGEGVLQIGRFSTPPVLEDLAALTVDKDDFDPRSCRVGDCGVSPAGGDDRTRAPEIDVNAPDAQARGAALFKQILLEDVSAYLSGAERMPPARRWIEAHTTARRVSKASSPRCRRSACWFPGFQSICRRFPAGRLPDAEDFLYWSKEKFGIAPFITVTHVTIVCRSAATCLMTTRDVLFEPLSPTPR